MYLNATSLENKLDEFKAVVDTYNPKIIAVSETWFKSNSVVAMPGYRVYRRDRNDGRRGGGVCLFIENSINSYELNDAGFNLSRVEQIWSVVYFGLDKYLVGCLYRPSDFTDMNDFDMVFKQARDYVDKKGFKDVLIMGDFNFPLIQWSNGSIASIKNDTGIEHRFLETLRDTFLYQHVSIPTFQMSNEVASNILDLIFTTESGSACSIDPRFVLGNLNKGHLVIFFDFVLKNKVSSSAECSFKFAYSKADFNKISQFISNVDWVNLFEKMSVQEMYDELIHYTSIASNQFIPTFDASQIKDAAAPWLKGDLKSLIRKKKNLRYRNCVRRWRDLNLSKEYKAICKLVRSEVKKARLEYEQDLVQKAKQNPKILYKYLNSQQVVKESIKALKKTNGEITQEPKEIANILNQSFQDVFVIEDDGDMPSFEVKDASTKFVDLDPNEITYESVLAKLKRLEEFKACGVDKLHPTLLKNCANAFTVPLTLIFRASLVSSQIPIQFRSANITPLFKKGDKTVASNYRPVSLTVVPCKIMEGILREKIEDYFYKNSFFVKEQHGFVKNKSCITNLLETLDFISFCIDNGIPVDVILLDFAKAFDTVPHRRLILKLKAYGIGGLVLKWIESFLKDRRQRVVQGEIVSSWAEIFSGVPQGSVIGPLLFVIFINDLPSELMNVSKLYADDTKIISKVNSVESVKIIQEDLDKAFNWTRKWLLKFNINKCVVMHYGHNNERSPFYIDGKQLAESEAERDLGVVFSTNLKWKNQVIVATNKANQMLGRIKKSFVNFDCKLLKSLYLTFIRPLLEFAVPVWSPFLKSDCDLIERVQHRASKLVPSIRNRNYEDRLKALGLTTLVERRQRGDAIQIYKFMHGMDNFDRDNRFQVVRNQVRGHCFKYHKEIARHQQREGFLFNRTANLWNSLPEHLVNAPTVNSFKANFDCWMSSNQSNRLS
jgi:hypothetical protein